VREHGAYAAAGRYLASHIAGAKHVEIPGIDHPIWVGDEVKGVVIVEETTNAVLTVSLSAATAQTVTVNYATANGTATAGTDYVSTNGTLTFLPGQTSQTITVTVLGDALDELNETILVNLTAATNATISDGQGVVTILFEPR